MSMPGKKKLLLAFLVVAWLALDLSLFKREVKEAFALPERISMSAREKKLLVDGEVYHTAEAISRLVPERASVTLFNENIVHLRKLLYYTYPRKVSALSYYDDWKSGAVHSSDYLAVFLPWAPDGASVIKTLEGDPALEKLASTSRGALFRVKGGAK